MLLLKRAFNSRLLVDSVRGRPMIHVRATDAREYKGLANMTGNISVGKFNRKVQVTIMQPHDAALKGHLVALVLGAWYVGNPVGTWCKAPFAPTSYAPADHAPSDAFTQIEALVRAS